MSLFSVLTLVNYRCLFKLTNMLIEMLVLTGADFVVIRWLQALDLILSVKQFSHLGKHWTFGYIKQIFLMITFCWYKLNTFFNLMEGFYKLRRNEIHAFISWNKCISCYSMQVNQDDIEISIILMFTYLHHEQR